jgi:hypothetical protein
VSRTTLCVRVAASTLLLSLFVSRVDGQGAIRSDSTLESARKRVEKDLLGRHLKLARKLKKPPVEWPRWVELKSALSIDPEHRASLKLLPDVAPFLPSGDDKAYLEARRRIDGHAAKKLGALLERAQRGGLEGEAIGAVARRLLRYDPDHAGARAALGFSGQAGRWLGADARSRRHSYGLALAKADSGKGVAARLPALTRALGLNLRFHESPHAIVAGVTVTAAEMATVARSCEVTWAALHYDLFGVEGPFSTPGDRPVTATKLKAVAKPLFLVLDDNTQHQRYLDTIVSGRERKARGKKLTFVSTYWKPEKVSVFESRGRRRFLAEWASMMTASYLIRRRFGGNRPAVLVQGLTRYYSGEVSGHAYVRMLAGGTLSDGKERFRRGDYDQLRALAREARDRFWSESPAGLGFSKTLDGLNRADLARATAFADFLVTRRRGELLRLLQGSDLKKRDAQGSLDAVFDDRAELARDFEGWFGANY